MGPALDSALQALEGDLAEEEKEEPEQATCGSEKCKALSQRGTFA